MISIRNCCTWVCKWNVPLIYRRLSNSQTEATSVFRREAKNFPMQRINTSNWSANQEIIYNWTLNSTLLFIFHLLNCSSIDESSGMSSADNSATLIDNFFINEPCNFESGILISDISDHFPISFNRKNFFCTYSSKNVNKGVHYIDWSIKILSAVDASLDQFWWHHQ